VKRHIAFVAILFTISGTASEGWLDTPEALIQDLLDARFEYLETEDPASLELAFSCFYWPEIFSRNAGHDWDSLSVVEQDNFKRNWLTVKHFFAQRNGFWPDTRIYKIDVFEFDDGAWANVYVRWEYEIVFEVHLTNDDYLIWKVSRVL
jgi:hypothetical protein